MRINLWLKREPNLQERKRGEGYREYPSPEVRLGDFQSQQQHFIDTTGFGFNQGHHSIGERFSLASSGTMSKMQTLQAMGSWFCRRLFRRGLETRFVKAISLSCVSGHCSA